MTGPPARDLTTQHVARAARGEAAAVDWLIERFTPALLAQVRYRLARHLEGVVDAEDVLQDVWLIALPKLELLVPRDGRLTPVLLRFLSSVVHNHYRGLLRQHVLGDGHAADLRDLPDRSETAYGDCDGVIAKVIASEQSRRLLAAIDELAPRDRELVILRGIEQADIAEVAAIMGMGKNHVSVAYRRALEQLRGKLTGTVFDDV